MQNKMSEHEESGFVFVGESLALDLVNTVVIVRGKQYDLLQTTEHLTLWWEEACQHHPQMDKVRSDPLSYDATLLGSMRSLRDGLGRLFIRVIQEQQPDEDEIRVLNDVLQMGYPALEWRTGSTKALYDSYGDATAGLLLPVALSARHLLTQADLSRLHQCHNKRCILLFYDTTKSGTRQWCSTACFDRERSLQRYEQKKARNRHR
jgi:predicted RNA-binding Zn ribbon-like protein